MIFRALAAVAVGAVVAWFLLVVAIVGVTRNSAPEIALRWHQNDSEAQAEQAERLITGDRAARARAGRLAQSALERSPMSATAARVLGIARGMTGDEAGAFRLLRYSLRLSRRDLPTQLLLIEWNVRNDNVMGALRHYDFALRTSHEASTLLFPILAAASADDVIADGLIRILRNDPPWTRAFLPWLVGEGTNPRNVVRITFAAIQGKSGADVEDLIRLLIARSANRGEFAEAFAVYSRMTGRSPGLVRDGDFEGERIYPPVDWQLASEPDLAALPGPRPGATENLALFLTSRAGRGGEVARQLLGLRPGQYALSAEVGNVSGEAVDRPYLSVTCAGAEQRQLARLDFPLAGTEGVAITGTFEVPRACRAQWIMIAANGSMDGDAVTPWIDSLAIRPRQ